MIKNYSTWLNESKVDPKELAAGTDMEMENTYDIGTARKKALDNLKRDPEYYMKWKKAGLIDEPEALQDLEEALTTSLHLLNILVVWDRSDGQMRRTLCDATGATDHDSLKKILLKMSDKEIEDLEKKLDIAEN